ncbi:MAG: ROK family transcriptional regulator [Boseongicola sp.]|nr:ROK family transcriptional regulator [Silicimonas sp.]NNF90159.1 ROK family transcriptional regulator [Boseongicola sp.]NNL35464.1 ROK family transcriptional regulator [Silicimonas sp.]
MHKVDAKDPVQYKGAKGSNQSGIRDHNERLLLTVLRRHGAMAKADIARLTGLSAQAVTNIMRRLEADGLIVKGEPQRGRVGQPSVPISLAADGAYFWGLKVGRRSSQIVLTNFLGEVVARERRTHLYPTPEDTIRFARTSIADLAETLPDRLRDRIAGLGIAMPFNIWRWAREIDVAPEKMAAWRSFDMVDALSQFCGCPVYLENDASAACGAELVFGDAASPSNFLYYYIGYFIGGGVVLGGALYTGPTGNAGALGPQPVPDTDGSTSQLLDVASLASLERGLRARDLDTETLWNDAEAWDVPADLLDDWTEATATALCHSIVAALSIIDFEAVLIDGWMPAELRRRLVALIREKLDQTDMIGLNRPELREGSVGSDARVLGAASLPLSRRFLLEAPRAH